VKATPNPPDMSRDCLSTVFSCFYWTEEFSVGQPRPCTCTMSFKKATHNVEILNGIMFFKETLLKSQRRAHTVAKLHRMSSAKGFQWAVEEATERRRKTFYRLHMSVAKVVHEFFTLVAEADAAAATSKRAAEDDASDAADRSLAHLSLTERKLFRASLRRLEIYEQILHKHPALFDEDSRQARVRRSSFGLSRSLAAELNNELGDKRNSRSWKLNRTSRDALADLMQEVFIDSHTFITCAKNVMANYARLPTRPLRRNRLKLNPQNHVRVLTFLYAGSLSMAAAKMLGPTSEETFVAIVFFIIYGVCLNALIWHHFIRYLCKQQKVRFDVATHTWKDDTDYVFDTMWQSIYDTVRDGVKGTVHPYFYRLAYYGLLLVKALVLGMPTTLMDAVTQMQVLLGVECTMLLAFAASCLPFAAVIMNIVQPLTHLVNIAVYGMIVFYDDGTGCVFSDSIQNWFIGLTAAASALPIIGLVARFVEIRIRICLNNRKVAEAKRLEDLAKGGEVDKLAAEKGVDQLAESKEMSEVVDVTSVESSEDESVEEVPEDWLSGDMDKLLDGPQQNSSSKEQSNSQTDEISMPMRQLLTVINRLLDDREVEARVCDHAALCVQWQSPLTCILCVCVFLLGHRYSSGSAQRRVGRRYERSCYWV